MARRNSSIERSATGTGIHPVRIVRLQAVAEANVAGLDEGERGVRNLQVPLGGTQREHAGIRGEYPPAAGDLLDGDGRRLTSLGHPGGSTPTMPSWVGNQSRPSRVLAPAGWNPPLPSRFRRPSRSV